MLKFTDLNYKWLMLGVDNRRKLKTKRYRECQNELVLNLVLWENNISNKSVIKKSTNFLQCLPTS